MKIVIGCLKCVGEGLTSERAYAVDLSESAHWITCEHGHRTATVIGHHMFEILSDVAACAIVDGYYREAVSSFTACIERFYETFLAVRARARGLTEAEWTAFWRPLANQSERQLGAFIAEYTVALGRVPELQSEKERSFRNEVIHKGRIPDRAKAIEYGQHVVDLIYPDYSWLYRTHEKPLRDVLFQRIKKASEGIPHPIATYGGRCLFSRNEEVGAVPVTPDLVKYLDFVQRKIAASRR